MVQVNIKKYSRSNIPSMNTEENDSEFTESNIIVPIKRGRGRPRKIFAPVETEAPPELDPFTEEFAPPPMEYHDEPIYEMPYEPMEEPPASYDAPIVVPDGGEFDDLNANNYQEPMLGPQRKESLKTAKRVASIYESSDLFDETGSEIIGKDRRVLINKLNQYRSLFPRELSKFKVRKGASSAELQAYLDEMATIVETSCYDNFLTDSILQSIKLVENGSKFTKYNISGCADLLKGNPQFNSLMKQMYVKYNVFSKIPCEVQLIILVTTTAYICKNKNDNLARLNNFLDEPVNKENT